MGVYDTYQCGDVSVQLKVGDPSCNLYLVGDKVADVEDGIYIAPEGAVVIRNGIVIEVTNRVFSKWGDELSCENIVGGLNPIVNAVKAAMTERDLFNE
jgi:hypothetical protein